MTRDEQHLCELDPREVFGETMAHIAESDDRLSVVVSDYGRRLSLERMLELSPQSLVQCGIAEQNQIEVAAALANEGFHVFVPSYATFATARVLDQIRVLMGMMGSPVTLVGISAGCEAAPLGASHMALEDIACLRTIPGITVLCPADGIELAHMLEELAAHPRPAYVRIAHNAKAARNLVDRGRVRIGKAELLRDADGAEVSLLAIGSLIDIALEAAELLSHQGVAAKVVEFATVRPLDVAALQSLVGTRLAVTIEDHCVSGGFGSAVAEVLSGIDDAPRVLRLGMPDEYLDADVKSKIFERVGLTAEGVLKATLERLGR